MNSLVSRVSPLACALAITFGGGLAGPASATTPTLSAMTLATAMNATGAAATPSGGYVREERSDHGTRSHAGVFVPLDANGQARYFVMLEGDAVASTKSIPSLSGKGRKDMRSAQAQNRANELLAQQNTFLSTMASTLGRSITPVAQYQHALNAVVVTLTPDEAARIAAQPGVTRVNRETVKELKTYGTHVLIGADTIWNGTSTPGNVASKGEGMVIGEIDTGINWKSKSFAATGSDGYTVQNPLGSGVYLGNCLANGSVSHGYTSNGLDVGHCNSKLIGIYNTEYSGAPSDATGFNPDSGQDLDGHGSHTASTAAGNAVNAAPYAGGTFNVSGMAPHANVIAYLACGTQTYSCYDTGLAAAYDQAVADGIVDALNYSIGGPEDSPWSSTIQLAALNAEAAGIFVAQAAGNDGPTAGSINGNESPWTTTVAASSPSQIPSFGFSLTSVNGSTSVPSNTQGLAAVPGSTPAPTQAYTNLPLIQSPTFSDGSNDGCSAFAANTFSRGGVGGIAVLRLDQNASNCGSATRRTNAAAAGATAVIYVDPDFISLGASGASYSVLSSAWNAILATPNINVGTNGNATATLGYPISANSRTPDLVTVYSSRGPIKINALKPDITAPGDNVLASLSPTTIAGYTATSPDPSTIYGVESGTSMATPHITGSAALVRAIHPSWTPMQVKSALMTTSATAYTTDGSAIADPTVAGAGRVDLSKATRASLLFDETHDNFVAADPDSGGAPETLNLASYYDFDCTGTCVFTRTVSASLGAGSWAVAVTGLPAGSYSLDKSSFSLGAVGSSTSYTLSIDASHLTNGSWNYGTLTLTSTTDSTLPVQHLPIAIRASYAKLRSDTATIAKHAAVGQSVTQVITVSNAGNPALNWSIPTSTLKAPLLNRPLNTTNGLADRTVVTSANSTQISSTATTNAYGADYFDVVVPNTKISEVAVHGFGYNSSGSGSYPAVSSIASQLAVRLWSDNGSGAPNGRPGNTVSGDVNPLFQFPAAAGGLGPTHAGVSFPGFAGTDDIIDIDLLAAGASPPALAAGRYWLNVTPSIVATSGSGTTAASTNYWYWGLTSQIGKTPVAVDSSSNSSVAANKSWRPINTSTFGNTSDVTAYAMKLWVTAPCSASWLSYSAPSGSLGLAGSAPVTVTLNATGLATGTYNAYVCLSGNGTSPENGFTDDEDAILVPVTFTVVAPPTTPTCSASPNPALSTQTVTVTCSGASANTTNTLPGATCSPSTTTNGSFTCTGTGGAIGSNPTLTTTTPVGDSATSTVSLTVNPAFTVTSSAGAGGSVNKASVDVASGGSASFTFTPNAHYHFNIDGDNCGGTANFVPATGVYTVNGVTHACTVSVTFALDTYTLTYTAGAHGSITGTSPQTVGYGLSGTAVTAVPDATYYFVHWSDGVSSATRTDSNVTANISATASFTQSSVTVTAVLDANSATHGSVAPATQQVGTGAVATINIAPNAGYNVAVSGDTCTATRTAGTQHWVTSALTQACNLTVSLTPDYVALNPARLLDTRPGSTTVDGQDQGGGAIAPGETRVLPVINRGGVPNAAFDAVVLNLTAVTPTGPGYLTVWSGDGSVPNVGNLNYSIGRTLSTMVIPKANASGSVAIYNGGGSAVQVTASVLGYFPANSTYQPATPQRFMDTRAGGTTIDGVNASAPTAGTQIDLPILSRGPLTTDVGAVLLSVTGFAPTTPGFVTVWPTGEALPAAGNLNLNKGVTLSNPTFAKIGTGGKVSFYNGSSSTVDLTANLQGWFPVQSGYTPIVPERFLDTRASGSTIDGQSLGAGAIHNGGTITVQIAGRGSIPASGVTAVAVNLVAVNSTTGGYLTLWPTGETQPVVGSINLNAGLTLPNLVISKLDANGKLTVFSGATGATDVVINVQGWFAGDN